MGNGRISIKRRMDSSRKTPDGAPEPQPQEGLTPEARAEWDRITGLLRDRKSLAALDQNALRDYVTCWARLVECERLIETNGVLVKGERGLVKNPAIQIGRTYRDHVMGYAREFGFTVAARNRMALPEVTKKENPFDHLDTQLPR